MLQRLTEDFEYASVLDSASKCKNPYERLAYVAAFTISSYSTTSTRTSKPFNPLLGETYECDRLHDLGWRAVSEQASCVAFKFYSRGLFLDNISLTRTIFILVEKLTYLV